MTVPLLLMTIGKVPVFNPIGTTNLICVGLTAYRPHAAPLIETETPFSSIGSGGARLASEASALVTVALAGARLTLDWTKASSPGAKPGAMSGVGLPVAVGDGRGE